MGIELSMEKHKRFKILLLAQDLSSRGLERQLVELIKYLKFSNNYDLRVVLSRDKIQYPIFFDLEIPFDIVERKLLKKDPRLFFLLFRICRIFRPDIIHVWSGMMAFYVIPASVLLRIPVINYQIQTAPFKYRKWSFAGLVDSINFMFAKLVIANSQAGLESYLVKKKKTGVIYNGVDLRRFNDLPDPKVVKNKYNINTKYAIIMAAAFSIEKKYDLFLAVAELITGMREDVSFIGVGENVRSAAEFVRIREKAKTNSRIILPGKIDDVEALINACDIGVLLTFSEGISNAIIEYMALCKPVIASDGGGTKEIIQHGVNGYLLYEDDPQIIALLINDLLDDRYKRISMGEKGRDLIKKTFSIEMMGVAMEKAYKSVLENITHDQNSI